MCIARNGVPPAVSKTVQLNVNCKKRPRRIRWREKPFLALKGYGSFMHAQPAQANTAVEWILLLLTNLILKLKL